VRKRDPRTGNGASIERFAGEAEFAHPTRSLNLGPPEPSARRLRALPLPTAAIERRDRLGGLIHEYNVAA
jgi:hypothetical protein